MTSFGENEFCWSEYNTDIETTYQDKEGDDEAQNLYQEELLKVFKIESYSNIMTKKITVIFDKVGEISEIDEIVKYVQKENQMTQNLDLSYAFVFLWGFDTFHLIHSCLREYKNTGEFNKDSLNLLKEKLKECI